LQLHQQGRKLFQKRGQKLEEEDLLQELEEKEHLILLLTKVTIQ